MAELKINKMISSYNYNEGNINRIKYIVIHYVGALGGAKANCEYYGSKYIGSSAHYFVGHNGEIWQCIEDQNIAWHCGAKSYKHSECRNSNAIGIEMCVHKRNTSNLNAEDKDWYFEDATVSSTIELTKYLMKKYGISIDHVIRHYDVTGKICPNPYVYNNGLHTWNKFKELLGQVDNSVEISPSKPSGNVNGNTMNIPGMYKVNVYDLKIRNGPGTNYKEVGSIKDYGVYTITEFSGSWGKLMSGAGWIALEHTERL